MDEKFVVTVVLVLVLVDTPFAWLSPLSSEWKLETLESGPCRIK